MEGGGPDMDGGGPRPSMGMGGGGPPIGLNMAAGGAPEGMEDGGGAAVAPPGGGRANEPRRRSAGRRSAGRRRAGRRRAAHAEHGALLSSLVGEFRRPLNLSPPGLLAAGLSAVAGPGTRSDELTGARGRDYKN